MDRKPLDFSDNTSIARLNSLTLMAECSCGHTRELYTLSLRRRLGAGITLAEVRAKLRCHKCGSRAAPIRVYERED